MLSELWSFIKASFKKRLVLYEIVVYSVTLSGALPNLLVSLFCLGTFWGSCALFMPVFTSRFVSQLRFLLAGKDEADQRVKDEVNGIAEEMGVKIRNVRVAKGLCNAYIRFGSLVLGAELLKRLSCSERQAVIAHELGHAKEKHAWISSVAFSALPALPLWTWSKLYWPVILNQQFTQIMLHVMIGIALIAYMMLVMVPLNWYLEIRADRIAARVTGKGNIVSALLAIVNRESFDVPSEDHPAVSERIKLILKDRPGFPHLFFAH